MAAEVLLGRQDLGGQETGGASALEVTFMGPDNREAAAANICRGLCDVELQETHLTPGACVLQESPNQGRRKAERSQWSPYNRQFLVLFACLPNHLEKAAGGSARSRARLWWGSSQTQ